MTLSIFRALATECRRDIALLAPSLMASIKEVMDAVPTDLEVVVRAATVVGLTSAVGPHDRDIYFLVHCLDNIHRWASHRNGQ
jgi:hypothetical protein